MKAVMVSCVSRCEERKRTLASLAAQGVYPQVFEDLCNPAGRQENVRIGVQAISTTQGDHLYCEDDIRANDLLPPFIELAKRVGAVTSFCALDPNALSRRAHGEIRRGVMKPRLEQRSLQGYWGGQCLYVPERVVKLVLANPEKDTYSAGGFDILLARTLKQHGEKIYLALPSPVQHTAAPSVVPNKPQPGHGLTFGLKLTAPMSEAVIV